MKKLIKIYGAILLLAFILVGCSNKSTTSSTTNKDAKIVIPGNNFSGTMKVDNSAQRQKVSIHFTKDHHAIVTFVGFNKEDQRWSRKIMTGKYGIINKNHLGINFEKGMDEGFDTKSDMQNHTVPTKMVEVPVKGQTLEMFIKEKYLDLTQNDHLIPTDSAEVSDYDQYINEDQQKYDHKYAKLSKRSFMSPATDMLANGIAFKGSNFIWKYGGPSDYGSGLDMGGSFAIFTGKYKLENHKLTLFIGDSTPLYQGTIMNLGKHYYQNQIEALKLPKELEFQFSKNNRLHLVTSSQYLTVEDMLDYGTLTGAPNYNSWLKKYAVNKVEGQMTLKETTEDSSSNTDSDETAKSNTEKANQNTDNSDSQTDTAIASADDFENFLKENNYIDTDSDNDYHAQNGNDYDYQVADSDTTVKAVYQVYWDTSDGALTHEYILADDGRIYSGNSGAIMMLEQDATDQYQSLK